MDELPAITVQWSDDHLTATLTCFARDPANTPSWTAEAVVAAWREALDAAGIVYGINEPALRAAAAAWLADGVEQCVEIAHGHLAVPGIDGALALAPEFEVVALPKPNGAQHSRAWSKLVRNVAAGTRLARLTLPTPGTPGRLVTGEEIPATPGTLPLCERSVLVHEVAQPNGIVEYVAAKDAIVQSLMSDRIQLVTEQTISGDLHDPDGEIVVWGDLSVTGSILPNTVVRVRGQLQVAGAIESAFVEAGGAIAVGGGIFGKTEGTQVRAGGSLTARFVQNARVTAGTDMTIRDSVVNSQLFCGGSLEVSGQRGVILTSRVVAGGSILVDTAGSTAEAPLALIAGHNPTFWQFNARLTRELEFTHRQHVKGASQMAGGRLPAVHRLQDDFVSRRRRDAFIYERILTRRKTALYAELRGSQTLPVIAVRRQAFANTHIALGPCTQTLKTVQRAGVCRLLLPHTTLVWQTS